MRSLRPKTVLLAGCLTAACGLLLAGCQPAKGSLSGSVTLDGKPLKGGNVNFVNKSGGPSATVEIAENGTYTVPTITAGDYVVTVKTDYLKPAATPGRPAGMPGMPAGMMPMAGGGPKGIPKDAKMAPKADLPEGYNPTMPGDNSKKYIKIPDKYGDEAQSGLTYKYTGGAQTFEIPLVSK